MIGIVFRPYVIISFVDLFCMPSILIFVQIDDLLMGIDERLSICMKTMITWFALLDVLLRTCFNLANGSMD